MSKYTLVLTERLEEILSLIDCPEEACPVWHLGEDAPLCVENPSEQASPMICHPTLVDYLTGKCITDG